MSETKPTYGVGVSVLLTNEKDQVLMAVRKGNVSAAGHLSTPGGRLEPEEDLYECAAREFKEETGATLGPVEIIGWKEHFRFGKHYFMFYAHASSYVGEITNQIPDKSEDWEWHSRLSAIGHSTEPTDILRLLAPLPLRCPVHVPIFTGTQPWVPVAGWLRCSLLHRKYHVSRTGGVAGMAPFYFWHLVGNCHCAKCGRKWLAD